MIVADKDEADDAVDDKDDVELADIESLVSIKGERFDWATMEQRSLPGLLLSGIIDSLSIVDDDDEEEEDGADEIDDDVVVFDVDDVKDDE